MQLTLALLPDPSVAVTTASHSVTFAVTESTPMLLGAIGTEYVKVT